MQALGEKRVLGLDAAVDQWQYRDGLVIFCKGNNIGAGFLFCGTDSGQLFVGNNGFWIIAGSEPVCQ